MDHHQFDEDILDKATKAILKTRDGKLRAAVPNPLGSCTFLNDVSMEEMYSALKEHKRLMKEYPRNGEGLEAFVDASDTGYTHNNKPVENGQAATNGLSKLSVVNDDTENGTANGNGHLNGNGHVNGNGYANGNGHIEPKKAQKHASGPDGVDGLQNGVANGVNGHVNGVTNGAH